MVTAGTYRKLPLFRSPKRLDFLSDSLLYLCTHYGWQLQAWAVFPNHYHFVAHSPGKAESLRQLVRHLHSVTAKHVNSEEGAAKRQVWFEYWDTRLTYEKSYLARLRYVHHNAVHHGIVRTASACPWCSARWFERRAEPAFFRTVTSFTGKGIKVPDDFTVDAGDLGF